MKRMLLIRLAMTAAVIAPLAACSDGNDNNFNPIDSSPPLPPVPPPPPPPPPAVGTLDFFGSGFAAIFRAAADSEPRDAVEGDIIPIDFTSEAVDPVGF